MKECRQDIPGQGDIAATRILSSNVVGDGGANSLLYIPATREELDSWKFSDAASYPAKEQRDDFWNYINQDKYLKNRKGKYAERGGAVMPSTSSS